MAPYKIVRLGTLERSGKGPDIPPYIPVQYLYDHIILRPAIEENEEGVHSIERAVGPEEKGRHWVASGILHIEAKTVPIKREVRVDRVIAKGRQEGEVWLGDNRRSLAETHQECR